MKTFKILFAAAIFLLVSTNVLLSQPPSDASETVSAEARVIAPIAISNEGDVSWGQVAQNTQPSIDPTNGSSTEAGLNDTDATVGRFHIDGHPSSNVVITWEKNDLSYDGNASGSGTEDIVWTEELSYLEDFDTEVLSGGTVISSGTDEILAADGDGTVFVGGSINVVENQMPGNYSGDITVTVEYQ